MGRALDEMKKELLHDHSVEIAAIMLDKGKLTIEEAAKFFNLPIDEVKELAKQQNA